MRTRATLLLLALLVVLGALAAWLQGPGRTDRPRERAALFPGLEAAAVRTVRVALPAGGLLLARDGGGWAVGERRRPADAAAVDGLLADLAAAREGAVASTNPAKRALYGVDAAQGIAVRLEGEGGRPLAAFTLGKEGPDFSSAYLLRDGEERVLLVPASLRSSLLRPALEWRDRAVLPFARDAITAVRVVAGGGRLLLDRSAGDGAWQVNGRAAEREAVERFVDLVATMRAAGFVEPGAGVDAELAAPEIVVTVEAGKERAVVSLARTRPETRQRLARRDGAPDLFLVSGVVGDELLKRESAFPVPAPAAAAQ